MERAVKRLSPSHIILFVCTILLAVLFVYPIFFALMSAFKSNGDILKDPVALPASLYLRIL